MKTAVVIVAAGSGVRLGSPLPKAFANLAGRPLLWHSLEVTSKWKRASQIVLVVPPGYLTPAKDIASKFDSVAVIEGGSSRGASVRRGISKLSTDITHVLVHDAARPLMPIKVFDQVFDGLNRGAVGVVPVVEVIDTLVKQESHPVASETLDRAEFRAVQTPQGFELKILRSAYDALDGEETDDSSVIQKMGHEVRLVQGDPRGFKITYPGDLARAETSLSGATNYRVAVAIDAHRFESGEPLRLGGVEWPGEKGLSGHSDGDAVLHSIVDGMLQAAGLGDLGTHFGSDRPEFAGASSRVFLDYAANLILNEGFSVSSVVVQVVTENPQINPRRKEVEELLSDWIGAPVSISATSTDGLGFMGRGEGLISIATVTLFSPGRL